MKYANIVLCKKPGPFDAPLTYRIPPTLQGKVSVGSFVTVPFRRQQARGVVAEFLKEVSLPPSKIRSIESFEPNFSLPWPQLELARFIASHYGTSLTRALKLMVPERLWEGKLNASLNLSAPADAAEIYLKASLFSKPVLFHSFSRLERIRFYAEAIRAALKQGKQVILMVPEILLAGVFFEAFRPMIGDRFAFFHSDLTPSEKFEAWQKIESGFARFILGSRSAIFSPAREPGLLILEQEQDESFKELAFPYYQLQDVAEALSRITGSKLILGSSSPRIESYYKVKTGDYDSFFTPSKKEILPPIHIVDMRQERPHGNFSIFSKLLQQKIADRLAAREKVILFVNQRGVCRAMACRECGHTETLRQPPRVCPGCLSPLIQSVGIGTEKAEETVKSLFPNARVLRADRDTVSEKEGFSPFYEKFEKGDYDLLIGTQLILKGLPFKNVTLTAAIVAEQGLYIPDFRSHERVFDKLIRLSALGPQELILQTYQPDHPVFAAAAAYDYRALAEAELAHRRPFSFPPFGAEPNPQDLA